MLGFPTRSRAWRSAISAPAIEGDELVAGCMSGDLFVFSTTGDKLTPIFHTWVEGAIGAHNGLVIVDLDGNGVDELYACGSFGIRKFILNANYQP